MLGMHILVVDDEWLNRELIEGILTLHGYQVVLAKNGTSALKTIGGADFVAAVIDMRMPDMSGYELSKRLRSNAITQNIRIILVSGIETEFEADTVVDVVMDRSDLAYELPAKLTALLKQDD